MFHFCTNYSKIETSLLNNSQALSLLRSLGMSWKVFEYPSEFSRPPTWAAESDPHADLNILSDLTQFIENVIN